MPLVKTGNKSTVCCSNYWMHSECIKILYFFPQMQRFFNHRGITEGKDWSILNQQELISWKIGIIRPKSNGLWDLKGTLNGDNSLYISAHLKGIGLFSKDLFYKENGKTRFFMILVIQSQCSLVFLYWHHIAGRKVVCQSSPLLLGKHQCTQH